MTFSYIKVIDHSLSSNRSYNVIIILRFIYYNTHTHTHTHTHLLLQNSGGTNLRSHHYQEFIFTREKF